MKNNNELLANLGNLCSRVLKFAYNEYNKTIPKFTYDELAEVDKNFIKLIEEKYKKYVELLNNVEIKDGLKLVMEISSLGNKYLQDTVFWKEESKKSGRTQIVISVTLNFIRLLSLLLEPYLPSTSAKINYLLGIERDEDDEVLGQIVNEAGVLNIFPSLTERSTGLKTPIPLFTQYSEQQVQEWRQKFQGNKPVEPTNWKQQKLIIIFRIWVL